MPCCMTLAYYCERTRIIMQERSITEVLPEQAKIERGSEVAVVLAFLYANDEYGFKPGDLSQHVSVSTATAATVLDRLFRTDLIQQTADGYYYAFDDPIVATAADELCDRDDLTIDTGTKPYPDTSTL